MPSATSELLVLGSEELESRLQETRRELLNLRFQAATGQLDNTARIRRARREVARLLTLLREREIAEAEGRVIAPPTLVPTTRRRRARVAEEALEAGAGAAEAAALEEDDQPVGAGEAYDEAADVEDADDEDEEEPEEEE